MKIIIIAEVPDDRTQDLFHHLHNFDITNPGCKFRMLADAPNKSAEEIAKMLNIEPPFTTDNPLSIRSRRG
jgi:hypothetical protein